MECCRLRVKDIDFSRNEIVVRAGKGDKDRHTMLPGGDQRTSLQTDRSESKPTSRRSQEGAWSSCFAECFGTEISERWVETGHGNGFFLRHNITPIGLPARSAAIIFTSQFYNELSVKLS